MAGNRSDGNRYDYWNESIKLEGSQRIVGLPRIYELNHASVARVGDSSHLCSSQSGTSRQRDGEPCAFRKQRETFANASYECGEAVSL